MYEMVCDINPDAGRVLNLIGLDPTFLIEECRLRDVYLSKDKTKVVIFTRIGGGNRESYNTSIKRLKNFKGYIRDYDDDFDNTYASFEYQIPANKLVEVVAFLSSSDTTTGGEKLKQSLEKLEKDPDEFIKEHPKFKVMMDDIISKLNN